MNKNYITRLLSPIFITLLISACGEGTVDSPSGGGGGAFSVVSTSPINDAEIGIQDIIEVTFSGDVDHQSLNAYTFQVMETEGMTIIEGKIEYNAAQRKVTFEPYIPLTYDSDFHLMVTPLIRNTASTHLSVPTNVEFYTEGSPTETVYEPANGANDVSTRSPIRIQFGGDVDLENLNTDFFSMVETLNPSIQVPLEVDYDEDVKVVLLWPANEFKANTQYSYTISSQVPDGNGNPYSSVDVTNSFTTVAAGFTNTIATPWDEYADSIKLVDNGATLIVAGETWGALEERERYDGDAFISAIDKNGDVLATIDFGSGGADYDDNNYIADAIYDMVTIGNDIYVTGFTEGNLLSTDVSAGTRKMFIAKYTWSQFSAQPFTLAAGPIFVNAGVGDAEGYAITANPSGTAVYVAGNVTNEGTIPGQTKIGSDDVFVAKFSAATLNQEWVKQIGTLTRDIVKGVAVDASNNVYVAGDTLGDFINPDPSNPHVGLNPFVLQLSDTDGSPSPTVSFDTGASSDGGNAHSRIVTGIVVDSTQLYLTGTQHNANGTSTFALTYPLSGGTSQYAAYGDTGNNEDEIATGIYAAPNGTIYVSITRFFRQGVQYHGATEIKSLSGNAFQNYKEVHAGHHASARSMVVDNTNTMFITGYLHGKLDGVYPQGQGDVFVARVQ